MVKAKRIYIVLLILPIIGCFIGGAFSEWSSSTLRIKWQPLGIPPSQPVEINSAYPLIVLGSDGANYSYKVNRWETTDNTHTFEEDHTYDSRCEGVESPPIDNVVYIIESCTPWGKGAMGYYYTRYALLQDGSIWKWEARHSADGSPIPFIEPIIGSAIFFLIAIAIVLVFLFYDLLTNLSEKVKSDDN